MKRFFFLICVNLLLLSPSFAQSFDYYLKLREGENQVFRKVDSSSRLIHDETKEFSNGNTFVRLNPGKKKGQGPYLLSKKSVAILIPGKLSANGFMELLFKISAAQKAMARKVVVVLEKAAEVGAHSLSGAVMNPVALKDLIPDYEEKGCPIMSDVTKEAVYYLGEDYKIKAPILPPPFKNHGNKIVSISKMNRWLAEQAEAMGINVFAGFSAVKALYDGDKVGLFDNLDRDIPGKGLGIPIGVYCAIARVLVGPPCSRVLVAIQTIQLF